MSMSLNFPLLSVSKKQPLLSCFSSSSSPSRQPFLTLRPAKANNRSTITAPTPRRTANYQPTIWDDSYIQSLPIAYMDEENISMRHKLKEEVKHLICEKKGLIEQLELIDALKQLGVSYHFKMEINDELSSISISIGSVSNALENYSLYGKALLFRLQRENGHEALAPGVKDLMNCFKSMKGGYMSILEHDIKAMLSLYEASYLAREGEDELDEAREFTINYLSNIRGHISQTNPQLVEDINHALDLPLYWRMPRLHTRWFIDAYERQESMNPVLLEFAKLDFNILQNHYKEELKEMSSWWRNLGLACEDFNFARDRLVENYLWASSFTFELDFWRYRKGTTKLNCFITTVDDIYDVYGTLEELELFTKAVDEWDLNALHQLPNFMRICLVSLFNTMDDIANTIMASNKLNVLPYLKRSWADLCNAYLTEARWYYAGHTPSLNDYLQNAWLSISGSLLLTFSFCSSDKLTNEYLNNYKFYPNVVRHSSMLLRLYDDLGTSNAEMQRGDISKSIQCYMKDINVSERVSREYIKSLIIKYWKKLNKEFADTPNLEPFKTSLLCVPRMAQYMYQHGDGHGEPNHKSRENVISLLINPIKM